MDKTFQVKGGFYRILPFLTLIILVCILALYFGNLLFGENSLSVLHKLKNKEESIRIEVDRLMNENARLQKELFELKGLEPK